MHGLDKPWGCFQLYGSIIPSFLLFSSHLTRDTGLYIRYQICTSPKFNHFKNYVESLRDLHWVYRFLSTFIPSPQLFSLVLESLKGWGVEHKYVSEWSCGEKVMKIYFAGSLSIAKGTSCFSRGFRWPLKSLQSGQNISHSALHRIEAWAIIYALVFNLPLVGEEFLRIQGHLHLWVWQQCQYWFCSQELDLARHDS